MNALAPVLGGMAANQSGKYTRKVMEGNARAANADEAANRERIDYSARVQMGRQLVDQANSGFQVGTGSPVDALRESAINRELDILTSRRRGEAKALGYRQQGNLARAQGKAALVGGIISGAATLMNDAVAAFGGGAGGGGGVSASTAASASAIGSFGY